MPETTSSEITFPEELFFYSTVDEIKNFLTKRKVLILDTSSGLRVYKKSSDGEIVYDEDILFLYDFVETRFDSWLNRHIPLREYEQTLKIKDNLTVNLVNYPVLKVKNVELLPETVGFYELEEIPHGLSWKWAGGNTIKISYMDSVYFQHFFIKAIYIAGEIKLPKMVKFTFLNLFAEVAANGGFEGDLSFLDQPSKTVTSVSVPGISKSWQNGQKKEEDGSAMDRLMSPLSELNFQRKFVY